MESTTKSKEDIWRDHFDSQLASGQSVRAWCKASDPPEHSFYWWRSKLALSPARKPSRQSSKPIAFAQVVVHSTTAEAKPIAIEPLRLRFVGHGAFPRPARQAPRRSRGKLVRMAEPRNAGSADGRRVLRAMRNGPAWSVKGGFAYIQ